MGALPTLKISKRALFGGWLAIGKKKNLPLHKRGKKHYKLRRVTLHCLSLLFPHDQITMCTLSFGSDEHTHKSDSSNPSIDTSSYPSFYLIVFIDPSNLQQQRLPIQEQQLQPMQQGTIAAVTIDSRSSSSLHLDRLVMNRKDSARGRGDLVMPSTLFFN